MPAARERSSASATCSDDAPAGDGRLGQRPPMPPQAADAPSDETRRPSFKTGMSPSEPELGAPVQVGSQLLHWGRTLHRMRDSTALYRAGCVSEWSALLQREGYLLLRGVLPPRAVLVARQCVCEALHHEWQKLDVESEQARAEAPDEEAMQVDRDTESQHPSAPVSAAAITRMFAATPLLRARIRTATRSQTSAAVSSLAGAAAPSAPLESGVLLTGYTPVTHDPRVLAVLEGPELGQLFSTLFGQLQREQEETGGSAPSSPSDAPLASASSYSTKWCRVHSRGEFTDEHTDYYRFEQHASTSSEHGADGGMFTCWMPLGCLPVSHGTLAVAEGSHKLEGYSRSMDDGAECKEEMPPGFDRWTAAANVAATADDASGPSIPAGVWRTASFMPGDVVVFDLRLVHASTVNTHPHFRLSMDTRWKATRALQDRQAEGFKQVPAQQAL